MSAVYDEDRVEAARTDALDALRRLAEALPGGPLGLVPRQDVERLVEALAWWPDRPRIELDRRPEPGIRIRRWGA